MLGKIFRRFGNGLCGRNRVLDEELKSEEVKEILEETKNKYGTIEVEINKERASIGDAIERVDNRHVVERSNVCFGEEFNNNHEVYRGEEIEKHYFDLVHEWNYIRSRGPVQEVLENSATTSIEYKLP